MNDDAYIGTETLEPDGYLQPTRYRITLECGRCGHHYSRITTKLDKKDPPCPKRACKEAAFEEAVEREARNRTQMFEEQRPPGHIGQSVTVKAIDKTAEIVMKDHGMTDLRDNLRMGDTMAPKLPGAMQSAADNFFGGKAVAGRAGIRNQKQAELLGRRAMAGAFRNMALSPSSVVPGATGESALRMVGKEKISG